MRRTSAMRRARAREAGKCSRCYSHIVTGRYARCFRCRLQRAEKRKRHGAALAAVADDTTVEAARRAWECE